MRPQKCDEINRLISTIDSGQDSFFGYENEKSSLGTILGKTLHHSESTSVIIYGPRGSGKTSLIETCLNLLGIDKPSRRWLVIKLDGLMHNTDALALGVIAEKLGVEGLTNASQIGVALQKKLTSSKPYKLCFFILDEIDVFCRRQQTLLYTLFDAIQNVNGICLIGTTAKSDCADYVEKRVRSRMSLQTIVLTTPFENFKQYFEYVNSYLGGVFSQARLESFAERHFKKSKAPGDLKKFMLDLLLNYESIVSQAKSFQIVKDRTIEQLESLTHLELAVVSLIAKKLSLTKRNIFRPCELFPHLEEIPSQISKSKELFLYVLNRLIDYGLVVVNTNQRSTSYISDWTSLSLNVDITHVKETIRRNLSSLPTNFHRILETNA